MTRKNIFNSILFLICIIFFIRSFNYSLHWYELFKLSLNGLADQIFWDFEVYKCSVEFFINKNNPYNLVTECSPSKKPFIYNYPPLTLFFFIPLSLINFFWSKLIWGFCLIFLLIIFIKFQKKLFDTKIYYFLYFLILIFSLDKTIIYSFFTGNISFILQMLVGISFYFILKRKINIFYLIICFVSFFKFYFAIFLICPFFISKLEDKKKIVAAITIIIFYYILNYLYDSVLFFNWIDNVYKASVAKDYYSGFGIGSLNYAVALFNYLENKNIFISEKREIYEILLTLLFLITIILFSFFSLNKIKNKNKNIKKVKLSISILLIVICIPRLEIYELIICITPLIFLLEKFFYLNNNISIQKLIINLLFISLFLLNGDSGITYPLIVSVTILSLYILIKKNGALPRT